MKNHQGFIRKLVFFISSIFVPLIFTNCELATWDEPVKAYMEFYTNSAAPLEYTILDTVGTGNSGLQCVESDSDKTVVVTIRNQQRYNLVFTYEFDRPEISAATAEFPNAVRFIQSDDKNSVRIIFKKDFLHYVDNGDVTTGGTDGTIIKDLSGTLTIKEETSLREFDPIHIPVMVDSIPPKIRGALFQRDKPIDVPAGETAQYIVCFNLKKLNDTIHEADTKDLYVGSSHYTVEFTGGTFTLTHVSGPDDLSTTAPAQLYTLQGGTSDFTPLGDSDGYVALYYSTHIDPDSIDAATTVTYNITLSDTFGLSRTNTVASRAEKLSPPTLNVTHEGTTYCGDDVYGLFELEINHNGSCFHFDSEGNIEAGSPLPSAPVIEYEVRNAVNGNLVASGTRTAPIKVNVERGKYYVNAFASYTGCIDSDENTECATAAQSFIVHRSQNLYVNASGSDEDNNGSQNNPYRTMKKCAEIILDMAQNDATDGNYSIVMQSDITVDPVNDTGTTLVNLTKTGVTETDIVKYSIEGNGFTIDASGKTLAMEIGEGTEVTLENVNIRGAGIKVDSGVLNFASGSIKNITSAAATASKGTAICAESGELYFGTEGMVTISGNICNATTTPYSVYVGGTATIHIGKAVIYDNKDSDENQRNLYLGKNGDDQIIVEISDDLTGSKIGINTESVPSAGNYIPFTSGYGFNGGNNEHVTPGTYFIGDIEGVGYDKLTGEAVIAKNGGAFNINFEEDISLSLESMYVPYHTEKEMKIIALKTETLGTETILTDVTSACSDFNYRLCYFGDDIGNEYYQASNTRSFIIKNNLRSGTYKLYVSCKYNNIYYSQELDVAVRSVDEFYVASNGDDSNPGTALQPLRTFGRALKLFEGAGSANFVTIHITGNVELGDISSPDRKNTLDLAVPSLTIDGGIAGASISGGANTILDVKSQSTVVIKNVLFVDDDAATYALKLSNANAKLTVEGRTALGKVYLKNGTYINVDTSLTLPSGVEKYAIITPERTALGTQVLKGDDWPKFEHFKLTYGEFFNGRFYNRVVNSSGLISLGYEFVPTPSKPIPDLSDDDIIGLINGASSTNGTYVWSDTQLCNAHANVGYDQERWARMVGTTMVFRTNEGRYGVMTLNHVAREKVGRKKQMMRAYWYIKFVGEGTQYSRGMDSENSDIDVIFAGTRGRTNDIHTSNGNAINGATFYVLHYGNKWPSNIDNCSM